MFRSVLLTSFCAAALVFPAAAQEAVESTVKLDAPKISETDLATPEWFSSFIRSSGVDESPFWQAGSDRDVSIAWTKGQRWSLNIDLKSIDIDSPVAREEMRAGATFRLTPRISVGGEVSVGAQEMDDSTLWEDQQLEAGIRLQSAFKF